MENNYLFIFLKFLVVYTTDHYLKAREDNCGCTSCETDTTEVVELLAKWDCYISMENICIKFFFRLIGIYKSFYFKWCISASYRL